MTHMVPRTFVINPGTLDIPVLPGKILPQRVAESVQQIRPVADRFKLLINVTGVGPKAALAILSQLTPNRLAVCVASGDTKAITAAQGVGAKLAQRVVLELKYKLKSYISSENREELAAINAAASSSAGEEAVDALVMLGYTKTEAASAVGRLDQSLSSEELIKQALRLISKNI